MKSTVIALGFFDGVHRGHGALLRRTAEVACRLDASQPSMFCMLLRKRIVNGRIVFLD